MYFSVFVELCGGMIRNHNKEKSFFFLGLCARLVIHPNPSYHKVHKMMKYVDLNIYNQKSINVKKKRSLSGPFLFRNGRLPHKDVKCNCLYCWLFLLIQDWFHEMKSNHSFIPLWCFTKYRSIKFTTLCSNTEKSIAYHRSNRSENARIESILIWFINRLACFNFDDFRHAQVQNYP